MLPTQATTGAGNDRYFAVESKISHRDLHYPRVTEVDQPCAMWRPVVGLAWARKRDFLLVDLYGDPNGVVGADDEAFAVDTERDAEPVGQGECATVVIEVDADL
jgi:hypothetical protein